MIVRVKLFAAARELAQADTLSIDVPAGTTISQLRFAISKAAPGLEKLMSHSLWAIDSEYVHDDKQLDHNADVAMIPPVSGG
jgi:molybdopterin converting factor subunit 1